MADGEIAWTNLDKPVRAFDLAKSENKRNSHPTQKPLALMHWCLNFAPQAKTVFDPYMGSGTTLLAAKQKGLKAVGIERELEYCHLAVDRLSQTTLNLFA
jgi:DNA modification methylase